LIEKSETVASTIINDVSKSSDSFLNDFKCYYSKDTYWPKNNKITERVREIKIYQEYQYFAKSYRQWLYHHLECGYPTFYSILGVDFNANAIQLQKNYEYKIKNSYFSIDVIEEAYQTIKNSELRKKYNRFLKMFQNYYRTIDENERLELNKKHTEWQFYERNKILLSLILDRHKNWELLYFMGINLFSIVKITLDCTKLELQELYNKYLKARSIQGKIRISITQIFLDYLVYKEYKAFLSKFPDLFLNPNKKYVIKKLQQNWKKFNFTLNDFQNFFLLDDPLMPKINNLVKILSKNINWLKHLPPHERTLYHVLDINVPSLYSNDSTEIIKGETKFRAILYEKYKVAKKTSETNLAYSVLKNPLLRANYDWMLKNYVILKKMQFLLQIYTLSRKEIIQLFKANSNIENLINQFNPLLNLDFKLN